MPRTRHELIDALSSRPNVTGILLFGSGIEAPGADLDLCAVVTQRPRGLESVHFWLDDDGPVDLNIRTLQEIQDGSVVPDETRVLSRAELIYEKEPGRIDGFRSPPAVRPLHEDPADLAEARFSLTHALMKLDYYKERDPLLCHAIICNVVKPLLRACARVRGREYQGEREALLIVRETDAQLVDDMAVVAGGGTLPERIEALRRASVRVLRPVGGLWRYGEVLYFHAPGERTADRAEWEEFFARLVTAPFDPPDRAFRAEEPI